MNIDSLIKKQGGVAIPSGVKIREEVGPDGNIRLTLVTSGSVVHIADSPAGSGFFFGKSRNEADILGVMDEPYKLRSNRVRRKNPAFMAKEQEKKITFGLRSQLKVRAIGVNSKLIGRETKIK